MSTDKQKAVWIVFWLASILTWVAYLELWMMTLYHVVLVIFGIISVCLGLWLVIANRFAWRSVLLVVVGLAIGQWWLIEQLTVQILWKLKGMAP